MRTNPFIRITLSVCMAVAVAETQAAQLEEIIITAQKREESLQEVPIAVSALSNESLVRANITHLQDLGNAVSGIVIENKNGYTTPKVRGVGTIFAGSGVYNAVATYVDDLYIARTYGNMISIDDAESVQVLKGPQGALYGRNATSGAIVVKTRDPEIGAPLEGKISVTLAEFDEHGYNLYLSKGLTDTLAGSLYGWYRENDGYWDLDSNSQNLQGKDAGPETNEWGFNAKLVFEPSDSVKGVFKLSHNNYSRRTVYDNTANDEYLTVEELAQISPLTAQGQILDQLGLGADDLVGAGLNTFQVFMATLLGPPPALGGLGFGSSAAIALAQQTRSSEKFGRQYENFINSHELGHYTKADAKQVSGGFTSIEDTAFVMNWTFNLDRFDLVSISGFRHGSMASASDVADIDPTSPGAQALIGALQSVGLSGNLGIGFTGQFQTEDYQQEFRLQSNDTWDWQWIVGAHYFYEDSPLHEVDGNAFGGYSINTSNSWFNESVSFFGQATFPLTSAWSFTLGARTTDDKYELKDEIDFANAVFDPVSGMTFVPDGPLAGTTALIGDLGTLKQNESLFTYLARLEYQAEDWMVYLGTSTGVKSGSLNNDGPAFGSAEPEELTSYEIGAKSEWLDGRLQVNGALYHYKYKDPQIVFLDQASGGNQLLNAADATVDGLDIDVVALVGDNTQVFLNATFLDSEYLDDTTYVGQTAAALGIVNTLASDGESLGGAADTTVVFGLDYTVPFVTSGELVISPNVKYSSGYCYDVEGRTGTGGAGSGACDSFTLANLNIRYKPNDANWSASLWAKNLTDEEWYSTGAIASGVLFLAAPADPQQIGATISYEF